MDPFLQEMPKPANRFRRDISLRRTLERLLEPDVFADVSAAFDEMGERAATEFPPLADLAESNPPRHLPYDGWGARSDQLMVHPAWTQLVRMGQEAGLVAVAYEGRWGAADRLVQAGLLHMFLPATATADCPLAMTDAAVKVLMDQDRVLADRYVPRLIARSDAWTSGQWMTEKQGGSDVGRSGTTARFDGSQWTLHGTKWFTSATTADIALALARPEGAEAGSKGLSLFLVELKGTDGTWNGITVRKLKDKLGTKALPTAELDLDGCIAVPVGELGRGVAKIAPMLNVTRLHAALGANSGVGLGLGLARDYAAKREAFGKRLEELPVHIGWIARIAAQYEAGLALGFRAAELLGQTEHSGGDQQLARTVIPLTKMACARQGVWAASEIIESFGGAGYVEDTGIPRLLRDVHVECIWEGTTSVMALDVLRALGKDGTAEAFLDDLSAKANSFDHPLTSGPVRAVNDAASALADILKAPEEKDARRIAWAMARTYQAALLCEVAGWNLDKHGDERVATALKLFTDEGLISVDSGLDMSALTGLAFGQGD